MPGMLSAEYGRRLRERAPRNTYVAGLVGGELQGRITTPEIESLGRNVLSSPFAPEGATNLIEAALSMVA